MMKKFYCTPIGRVIPIIFIICILIWIYLMMHLRQEVFILFAIINILLDLIMIVYTAKTVVRRVELYSDKIVCKGLLPSQTYEIEFEKCNIGMDYSWRSGGEIWWIYICYGPPPRFKSVNSPNRMNAEKFKPGFIKMHYNDKVYDALLEVLPKQQRSALISAKKWADKAKNK